jgi:hypothetical protein
MGVSMVTGTWIGLCLLLLLLLLLLLFLLCRQWDRSSHPAHTDSDAHGVAAAVRVHVAAAVDRRSLQLYPDLATPTPLVSFLLQPYLIQR